ncbi:dynein axonemal intermediate chain 3 [Bactrocera oleae]|uniref:dynein axonemal intermediate chain 3 n=1 Tax=Bactrocera oleae TaxID=104688 RepID=UPI0006B7D074|nr:WD repeat-containing protein 63 [Bactrocera oleae]XP_036220965.1 WD repeat-containing protein 63 [Bactrocera oleae]
MSKSITSLNFKPQSRRKPSKTHLAKPTTVNTVVTEQDDMPAEEDSDVHLVTTGKLHVKKWREPDSDDEGNPEHNYDIAEAWRSLFSLPSCHQIILKENVQRRLQLLVGLNVTQEFPWKQIRYKSLIDQFENIEDGDFISSALEGFNLEDHLLFGYTPILTENQDDVPEGDPFIVFLSPADAKIALTIIRNMELYERWLVNKRLIKKPRRWISLGSENEVNMTIEQAHSSPLEVEVQSVYPLRIPELKEFSLRKSTDIRDGYVELLPSDLIKFENVTRRRVTIGIQSAPTLIDLEQQTDPTFPTNAWAQYLYEINDEDGLDETSEDEASKDQIHGSSRSPTPSPIEPRKSKPQPMSPNIRLLLDTLEFNQIDMYRNDYAYICNKPIEHYTTPHLEETLCFANISKSYERYVCGIDWYSSLSGLIATSYTFNTPATVELISRHVDVVQRAVLQPNPILMWSFADNLNYKLEFETSQEVTVLSFCPHDPNILFGGGKNGQIIAWDLQGRAEKLDTEEILTAAQSKYRVLIADFLKWTIQINEDAIVPPVMSSALEVSQKSSITGIYWLGQHFYVNSFGKTLTDPNKEIVHKFFLTCSVDGTISFWDLDSTNDKKLQAATLRHDQPKALTQSESIYKNKVLKPIFTIVFNEPITSIFCDSSVFHCKVPDSPKKRVNSNNFATILEPINPQEIRQSVITSSFYGHIERLNWLGSYADEECRENVSKSINFARVHDGPVIAIRKNPFYPVVFVSIGRTIFAVWKENFNYSPIFWRKCSADLTSVTWSESRPGILYLTRIDGNMEAWDILARDDDACYNDILGGGIITAISEHRPSEPEKLLGIGDYNSSFRMMKLPQSFYTPEPKELEKVKEYFSKEENRKKSIQAWEHQYFENNRDIIEAKRQAEIDTRKELERLEKEYIINATRKVKEGGEENKDESKNLSYTERMKRKWDELNLNRLLSILMSRKRVDEEKLERETRLEKKHLAYEAAKKQSLIRIQQRVGEEVASVRARILPHEKVDLQRIDMIISSVRVLMESIDDYADTEMESNEIVKDFDAFDTLSYIDFLYRGDHRRRLLNKSIGGNTERIYWYECIQDEDLLEECSWWYDSFLDPQISLNANKNNEIQNFDSDTRSTYMRD